MLLELRIRNLVVVEDAHLTFTPGLNVLTGSTGAGKSLILGAVNLLLGHKASTDLIRSGADEAEVTAVLQREGGGAAGESLTVRRVVRRNGRSHAFVGGEAATVRQLGEVCAELIEPHGQNEQFRLKDPDTHVAYVDSFAKNGAARAAYARALGAYREASAALASFDRRIALLREKEELLSYRVNEVANANIEPGEGEDLERRAKIMANAERIYEALAFACNALYDDEGAAASLVAQASRRLGGISGFDDEIDRIAEQIESAAVAIGDGVEALRSRMDGLEFDPAELERVQERLAFLRGLERRYEMSCDALLDAAKEWEKEIEGLEFAEDDRAKLVAHLDDTRSALAEAASALSSSRQVAARKLDAKMTRAIDTLMMRGARFRTDIAPDRADGGDIELAGIPVTASETGTDVLRFAIRTNPGEDEGPLERVASTGELSRIALALKELVSAGSLGAVLVFDEIDAGIGADLGTVIADRLHALGRSHQIICITHMPQIAARGDHHLTVVKESDSERARVRVQVVDAGDRTRELARMLGGESGSDHRVALAAEMLRQRRGAGRAGDA